MTEERSLRPGYDTIQRNSGYDQSFMHNQTSPLSNSGGECLSGEAVNRGSATS